MKRETSICTLVVLGLVASLLWAGTACSQNERQERPPQPREHGAKVAVDPKQVVVDDGDTVVIHWTTADAETVRILGIDTPETRHVPHNLPYAQEFGYQAGAFAQGAFAAATEVKILRASSLDFYGRTLGYLFVNGTNYSVLVIAARLAEETISRYGDGGFPDEATAVTAAAAEAGPVPFQSPGEFRRRMREVSSWMREQGIYPEN
jgi:micrococcal nuclease